MPIEIDLEKKIYSRSLLSRKCEFILCRTDDCVFGTDSHSGGFTILI